MLVLAEIKVVNRGDPKKKWADKKPFDSSKPIYAGEKNGDMVSWRFEDTDSWTNVTFYLGGYRRGWADRYRPNEESNRL